MAPFEYTALVWATLLGLFIYGDFPGTSVWLGVAIIVLAGLYALRRETALSMSIGVKRRGNLGPEAVSNEETDLTSTEGGAP